MLEFLDDQLIQSNADHQGGNTDGEQQEEDVFSQLRPKLLLDIVQGEIGDQDSGNLLFGLMARETFLPEINWVYVPKDLFSSGRRINYRFVEGFCRSVVADLTGGIMDIDDSSHFLIVDGDYNPADSIEDENVFDIRILMHRSEDIFHLVFVLRKHGAFQDVVDHLGQMGTDVLLKVVNHLLPVLKVLDGKKDRHRDGEETDQSEDDLEAKAFIKFDPSHRISSLSLGEEKV